ncbi:MAG: thiamine-phosphate kinase [Candidatus Omnitrophota bacterium]|jgi:thiamine-monophosphate kinase
MKELELIKEIRKGAGKPGKPVVAGIGDDCAVLPYDKGHYLLWGTDMLVEGTHFVVKEAGFKNIGRKAVAVNISDIAAMGGVPKYVTVNLGVTRGIRKPQIRALYEGIFGMCREYGIKVIGGDTNRSDKFIVDVSIIGFVEKKNLLSRSGAEKGDLVLVTGPVRNGKKEHLSFVPRMKESRFLARNFKVSSMIDVSDGIAVDLGHICEESGKGCVVYSDAVPLSKGLLLDDALYYGESFELLFTMDVKEARKLFLKLKSDKRDPVYFVIGEMTPKKKGMRIIGKEGRESFLRMEGFKHL